MPSFNNLDELHVHQLQGLQWTVKHVYQGSEFYRQRLEACGVGPEDISSLDDIRKLPFTTADDLRDGYPFPLLSVPESQVVRIHASSGTTGKRKILCYTQKDIDDWVYFFARCYEMAGLNAEDEILVDHLPTEFRGEGQAEVVKSSASVLDTFFPMTLREMEKIQIEKTIDQTDGNKSKAAVLLGISRQTLREKLKAFKSQQEKKEAEAKNTPDGGEVQPPKADGGGDARAAADQK